MTSLALVGGVVLIIAILIGVVVSVSKKSGSSTAERDALRKGERLRNAFEKETSRSVASGRDLIERLRNMGR